MLARIFAILITLALLPLPAAALAQPEGATPAASPAAADGCAVTLPNGEVPPGKEDDSRWFGSDAPAPSLWLLMPSDDGVRETTWSRYETISGYTLKVAFWRGHGSGDITLTATDAISGGPVADQRRYLYTEDPYPIPGLIAHAIVIPEPGCWTITATDGNDTLVWTTRVTTIGNCPVTIPNGETPPAARELGYDTRDWLGSGATNASLWLMVPPSEPIVPPAVFEPRDAGGYSVKTPFWRGEGSGPIQLTGDRIDQRSPFEPHIDAAWDGYPTPGFIATGIWFPTEGCWKLTATDGNDTLTWTVLVRSPFADCDVTSGADDDGTIPGTVIPGTVRGAPLPVDADDYFGENGLYVTLGPPDRLVRRFPVNSGLVSDAGAMFDKFVWYREGAAEGDLSITVENTTQWFPEEPEVSVPSGYGTRGVQASGITFPGPGCWEITGTSGDVSITFTVRYEIIPGADWLPPQ